MHWMPGRLRNIKRESLPVLNKMLAQPDFFVYDS